LVQVMPAVLNSLRSDKITHEISGIRYFTFKRSKLRHNT
jgi:hypothetical protein